YVTIYSIYTIFQFPAHTRSNFFLNPTEGIESSIDRDDGPGHKTGGITDQPMDGPSEFVRPAKAFHRGIVDDRPAPVRITSVLLQQKLSVLASNEKARGNCIDPNASPIFQSQVGGHPFGEIVNGRLGCGIAQYPCQSTGGRCGGYIDNASLSLSCHLPSKDQGGQHGSVQVQFGDFAEISHVHFKNTLAL